MALLTASEWETFLAGYPQAHLLQTAAWGELKSGFGWEACRLGSGEAGAQVLIRHLFSGLTFAYIPKGPPTPLDLSSPQDCQPEGLNLTGYADLWREIDALCRQKRAAFLKLEPDGWQGNAPQANPPPGFRRSPHSIQPLRTLLVDLSGDETILLERMKPKTRYNIRLAQKKGVVVRPWDDIGGFYRLMQITGQRDEFGVHSQEYYQWAYDLFFPRGECNLLLAEYEGVPLAALMAFAHGPRAWYFYGASSDEHRDRMPAYLLQWEAIRWARAQGCRWYDLWGVPDEDETTLEAGFTGRSDGLWGVYRFKRGFGGRLCRSPEPIDRVYQPGVYAFYRWWNRKRSITGS